MYGPGEELMDWNNTGVYKDFAGTKGKVLFPKGRQALRSSGDWKIFFISDGIFLITYSKNELGIMAILRADSAEKALNKVIKENSDVTKLKFQFNHPNGNFIEFDLDSQKNKWVITKVNKKAVDRDFDQWPFFEGDIEDEQVVN